MTPTDPTSEQPEQPPEEITSWTRTLDAAAAPVQALIEAAPHQVGDGLAQRVAMVLQTALDHAQAMFDPAQMEERLRKARAYPGSEALGYEGHLMAIEEKVAAVCAEVKSHTTVGSCLTGFAGAAGQLADIPAFYLYAVHSLQEIAINYGFDPRLEREQKLLLQVLRIGHLPGRVHRYREVDRLDSLDLDKDLATVSEISYALTGRGLFVLSRQLLKALLRRKAATIVPVLGAVVNAGINRHLMSAILDVGQRAYRRRFVRRAQMIAADRL